LAGTNAGLADAFLAKFDEMGNQVWSRQLGTSSFEVSSSVAVDSTGGIYITGFSYGALAGTQKGPSDLFLFKFNSTGDKAWSQQIGSGLDSGWSITVSSAGNIYVGGSTTGELGPTKVGGEDAFLIKFAIPEPSSILLVAGLVLIGACRRH
jgi:outer membrane protein assembly factor BamB